MCEICIVKKRRKNCIKLPAQELLVNNVTFFYGSHLILENLYTADSRLPDTPTGLREWRKIEIAQ